MFNEATKLINEINEIFKAWFEEGNLDEQYQFIFYKNSLLLLALKFSDEEPISAEPVDVRQWQQFSESEIEADTQRITYLQGCRDMLLLAGVGQ